MSGVEFLTREIGSLGKPPWRVKAFAGRPLDEVDVNEAERWGTRLEVEGHEQLVELLRSGRFGEAELADIDDWAAIYAIRLLERTGLDVVYDGEQRRTEMYDHVAAHASGFEARGTVRSFDNKYYAKAAVVEPPTAGPQDVDEFRFVTEHTNRAVKVPLTGAYTMVDWSYDEHYSHEGALGATAEQRYEGRRRFVADVAERVIRPNVDGLVAAGADWLQIDEPAATTKPHEVPLVVEGFNAAFGDVTGAKRSMHICFSDYAALWPQVLELEDCLELQLEFANRDSRELGVRAEDRPGYVETLRLFKEHGYPDVGLGVLDIHSDFVEPAELVRDRILFAVDVLGDPGRIRINPDCGLRTRSWDVVYEKLLNMVEGTRLAERELNRAHAAPAAG
jgi:5-methyltetrahydropteroyltriglutamate--homocysteine methyltransferase